MLTVLQIVIYYKFITLYSFKCFSRFNFLSLSVFAEINVCIFLLSGPESWTNGTNLWEEEENQAKQVSYYKRFQLWFDDNRVSTHLACYCLKSISYKYNSIYRTSRDNGFSHMYHHDLWLVAIWHHDLVNMTFSYWHHDLVNMTFSYWHHDLWFAS